MKKGKYTITLDKDQVKIAKKNLKKLKKFEAPGFKLNLSNLINHLLKGWNEKDN